jgi:hypothetical protein
MVAANLGINSLSANHVLPTSSIIVQNSFMLTMLIKYDPNTLTKSKIILSLSTQNEQ